MKFEDISTGGGCKGYYVEYKKHTFYVTTMHELTLPKNNEIVSMGIYDKDFEDQLASITIKDFKFNDLEKYVKNYLSLYLKKSKKIVRKHQHDIFYMD